MMPHSIGRLGRRGAFALLALALVATSCSRSLPTAPTAPRVGRGTVDEFATAGLENQVVVTLAPGADASSLATQYGAVLVNSELDERTAALRPISGLTASGLMDALAADGRVETAEPNGWLEPAEARQQSFAFDDGHGAPQTFLEQPAAAQLHLDQAHDVATGLGVKVAIIDTGADLQHPMLRRSIVGGWDFVDNDANPTDQKDFIDNNRNGVVDEAFGHGTHVAGLVHLVAPESQLLIVRVLDADGRGDIVNVAAGVRWAVEQGAKVINLSLGSTKNSDALQNVLEDAALAGVTVVAAAGNQAAPSVDFPGRSSKVIGVAAVDADDAGAPFSSFDHSNVALSAPGVGIRSTFPGGGFKLWTGTSMSSPFVTGAAALLAEIHPAWSLEDMTARLQSTCNAITSVPVNPDPSKQAQIRDFGSGALDVGAALAPDFGTGPNQTPGPETVRPH